MALYFGVAINARGVIKETCVAMVRAFCQKRSKEVIGQRLKRKRLKSLLSQRKKRRVTDHQVKHWRFIINRKPFAFGKQGNLHFDSTPGYASAASSPLLAAVQSQALQDQYRSPIGLPRAPRRRYTAREPAPECFRCPQNGSNIRHFLSLLA